MPKPNPKRKRRIVFGIENAKGKLKSMTQDAISLQLQLYRLHKWDDVYPELSPHRIVKFVEVLPHDKD